MQYENTLFIFRRDLRLFDNTGLINADKKSNNIIPIFIFDPHQLKQKYKSNNCIQFMVESLDDLDKQLHKYNSRLYTLYGNPWKIVEQIIKKHKIDCVMVNRDYSVYSRFRDWKIKKMCDKYSINFEHYEDILLNNIETIKNTSNKNFKKYTPYYNVAKRKKINKPIKYIFKNLMTKKIRLPNEYKNWSKLYKTNNNLYVNGGRTNALKILKNIKQFKKYNEQKNYPKYDTTKLSPHNKFGTVSIREEYHTFKKMLGNKNDLIRQLYWRDFYYNQIYFNPKLFTMHDNKKYNKIKWTNNTTLFNKWKNGNTGIAFVDAAMTQLNETGWMHNRARMVTATVLTKIYHIDWRYGERYFKTKLIDYDVTQNIMNWYWISSEATFSNPYFRVLNPLLQSQKYDPECEYIKKWIKKYQEKTCEELQTNDMDDIKDRIKRSITKYSKI